MIHYYRLNGFNIVLDCSSGSIHVVDDLVFEMLPLIENEKEIDYPTSFFVDKLNAKESEIKEAYEEIKSLISDGTLFSEDAYEIDIDRFSKMPTVVKAACLNVSHDCNLACKYCFAGEGEYHGKRELMDVETGKRALEFLIENSGSRKNIEVDFFGGEPLINFDVVKDLVSYGRKLEKDSDKKFRFTLTTNGVLIDDDFMDFADKELVNVVLSMDGRKEIHDFMRPFRGGQDSYDHIVTNVNKFVEKRGDKKHYIRGTFTRHNLDFSKDILHMADLGYKEISIEPVVAPDSEDYAIKESDVPVLLEEYEKLAVEMANRQGTKEEFNFFHFNIDLTGGPCVYKRLSGCGAGSEYVAITPNGDIYPCHQFVGMQEFIIGNVFTGIRNTELMEEFKGVNVYTKKECKTCFANMYCSGGCMANAYNSTGDIKGVYSIGCELERKRVECAIMLEINKRLKSQ